MTAPHVVFLRLFSQGGNPHFQNRKTALVGLCNRENVSLAVVLAMLGLEEVFLAEVLQKYSRQSSSLGNAVPSTEKQ